MAIIIADKDIHKNGPLNYLMITDMVKLMPLNEN